MSTPLLVATERQPGSLFGLGQKQAKKPKIYGANAPQLHPILKKYGANAPQLRSIRCSIDFCVMLCNEQAKKQKIRCKRAIVAPYCCCRRSSIIEISTRAFDKHRRVEVNVVRPLINVTNSRKG